MSRRYRRQAAYVRQMARLNQNNPNLSDDAKVFLEELSKTRHFLHAQAPQYFFRTRKTREIDHFFILFKSKERFEEMGLPFPDELYAAFSLIQEDRISQEIDIDAAISKYSSDSETFNDCIEAYLRVIDREAGTHYAPSGHLRGNENPVERREEQLHRAYNQVVEPAQRRLERELNRFCEREEQREAEQCHSQEVSYDSR